MAIKFQLLFLLCYFILQLPAYTQESWTLKKDKEGIKVYTKKVEGSDYKAFRGTTTIDAPATAVVAAIRDLDSYVKWSHMTKTASILAENGETELVTYVQSDAPWPVSDRDGIYVLNFSQDPTSKVIKITTTCSPDYIAQKEGYVRVPSTEGFWEITPKGTNKCLVNYENHSEPGGSIPGWLANSSVINIPFNTLSGLKEVAKERKYQGKSYGFISN